MRYVCHVGFVALVSLLFCSLPAEEPATVAALQKRVAELEAELAALRRESVSYAVLSELDISLSGMNDFETRGTGKVSQTLKKFLQISEEEETKLKKLHFNTLEAIKGQIVKQAPVAEKLSNGYRLEVKEFPVEGKQIEATYYKEIYDILGSDRAKLFKQCQLGYGAGVYFEFGEQSTTYTFTGVDKTWQLKTESKRGRGRSSSMGSYTNLSQVAVIKDFLPKELLDAVKGDEAVTPRPTPIDDF